MGNYNEELKQFDIVNRMDGLDKVKNIIIPKSQMTTQENKSLVPLLKTSLEKEDLLCLVKGTGGPGTYRYATTRYGDLIGFPGERWRWNDEYLNKLSESELWDLYQEIKNIKNER